jgi:hypothetical protein
VLALWSLRLRTDLDDRPGGGPELGR